MDINKFRPIPFYFITTTDPADYTEAAVFSAMAEMKNLGFGGIVLFNKPPTGFNEKEYLSDTWFDLTEKFIFAARKYDLQLWINDGFNFPPGDAAGRIEAVNPGLKQLRLIPNPAGRLEVAEVPWGFPAFEEEESSRWFIHFVYEEYYKRFAEYFGNGITGFFSDADNRRFNAHVMKDCPERYYPWSKNFAEIFAKEYGYSIVDNLDKLFNGSDKNVTGNYWELCGKLYQQWFANNHAWCKAHNVLYTFHSSDTGPLSYEQCKRSSVFTEGNTLELLTHSDCPGTDHEIFVLDGGTHYDSRYYTPKVTLNGDTEFLYHPQLNNTFWDIRAKYASSAAVLGNKERVMCEMFAATNFGASFNDLQRIAAWQIMQGINFIIPHAVHHRFRGETKFFAPPEFSKTVMKHTVKHFNDRLAQWCMAASAGEYVAEYAVKDPTEKVFTGQDATAFFKLCDKLNRHSCGYVIVPQDYSGEIKHVVDPLVKEVILPADEVSFTGGELAYMRRSLNGEVYLLAANVWQEKTVSGTLKFNDKEYVVELCPGEIAIFGGPFESYRTPAKRQIIKSFDAAYPFVRHEENVIPFEQELTFNKVGDPEISLLVPAGFKGEILVNGVKISGGKAAKVFDDEYQRFKVACKDGEVCIYLTESTLFHTPALLAGNFSVEVSTCKDYAKKVYETYLLEMYEPEKKIVTVSPAEKYMTLDRGWEKQKMPFYSGGVSVYMGKFNANRNCLLELPGFNGSAELLVNGKSAGQRAFAPYSFELPEGENDLELRLWNTMANRMERYAAASGLTEIPVITEK